MKVLLYLISLLAINSGAAQISVLPIQIAGDTNSCTNTVVIETLNPITGCQIINLDAGLPYLEYFNGDTINNFCYGYNFADGRIGTQFHKEHVGVDLGFSSLVPAHLKYHFEDVNYPSTKLSNDGSITIMFDSVVSNYTFNTYNSEIVITELDSFSIKLDSLSYGRVDLEVVNIAYIQDFIYFGFAFGYDEIFIPTNGLNVNVSYNHSNGNCNGSITLNATNSTGSVNHFWNEPIVSTDHRVDLCPGVYTVYSCETVSNFNYYYSGKFDTIVLTNDDLSYVDTNLFYLTPQDTVNYNFVSCGFNYNAPIDSMHYTEDTLFQSGGLTIVNFTMEFYQGSNIAVVTDSLVMLDDSLIFMDVVLYCYELKSTEFGGRRIKFLRGINSHGFQQDPTIGLLEKPDFSVNCKPNPVVNELTINVANTDGIIRYSILDIQGKVLIEDESKEHQFSIPLMEFAPGNYMLQIETNKGNYQERVLKQ